MYSSLVCRQRSIVRCASSSSLRDKPVTLSHPRLELVETDTTVAETIIDGGVRVLSVDSASATTSVSLFVRAGSRFENRATVGSAHFLHKLAFRNSTQKSALRTIRDIEHFGATYSAYVGREDLSFHTTSLRTGSPSMNVLVESMACQLNPQLQEWEINSIRPLVQATEHEHNWENLMEVAHFEGFHDSGLGNSILCPSFNIENIDGRHLHSHVTTNYFPPNRITVVGTGVKHNEFLSVVKPLFAKPTLKGRYPELAALPPIKFPQPPAQSTKWKGGSVSRLPGAGNAAVLAAFSAPSFAAKEHTTFSLLASIITSSGKFQAIQQAYSDTGVFGLYGEGEVAGKVAEDIQTTLKGLAGSLTQEQLDVAKKGLILCYFEHLENPIGLGACLNRYGPSFLDVDGKVKSINDVSLADLQKAASSLTDPVLVASGNIAGL